MSEVVSITAKRDRLTREQEILKLEADSEIGEKRIDAQKRINRYLWSKSTGKANSPDEKNLALLEEDQSKLMEEIAQLKG